MAMPICCASALTAGSASDLIAGHCLCLLWLVFWSATVVAGQWL